MRFVRCRCGKISNFGLLCAACSKDVEVSAIDPDDVDVYELVDEDDHEELDAVLKKVIQRYKEEHH